MLINLTVHPDQEIAKLDEIDSKNPSGSKLAFVGDGINDAPVLARADVGIAMRIMKK